MSCNIKTLKVFRGYATGFNGEPLLTVSFNSEISITGWGARFEVGGISKSYTSISSGFSVNLTAEETSSLPVGLNNGSLILIDAEGNDRPVATDLPILVAEWVEGDIELDGFEYTATLTIEENELTINIQSATAESSWTGLIDNKIAAHNVSTTAHADIRTLVANEVSARTSADNTLQSNIDAEESARESADETLQDNIDAEAETRSTADSSLSSRINAEVSARTSADTALGSRIDAEASARGSAITTVTNNLNAEISARESAVSAEEASRRSADTTLTNNLNTEIATRENADTVLSTAISTEASTRASADTTINARIDVVRADLDDLGDQVQGLEGSKQDVISDLSTIRSGASAGATALQPNDLTATSPIVYSNKNISLASGYTIPTTAQTGQIATNTSAIATINGKIPNQATSSNQLADKDFVNSSINNVAAFYLTSNAAGSNFATHSALVNAETYYFDGSPRTPTKNDYAVVNADEDHDNATTRYIYTGTQFAYQYVVNNTPFTAAQQAAINSGATSTLIGQISTNQSNITTINTTLSGYGDIVSHNASEFYLASNPSGYQTASQVSTSISTALNGYATQTWVGQQGYLTGITSAMVTTALGYTPTDPDDLGTMAYADAVTNGDISGTINQDKITNLTTDLGNKVTKNSDITAGTHSKITYDAKGLVTGGSDLALSDLGITATATELNYTDGVTSNIQTQLDAKAVYPTQTGQSGKFLTTNGTSTSWGTVDALPTQTGHSGSVLTTDGSSASWVGTSECAVVIESKRPTLSDPSWYRIYSDGWVEQGGLDTTASTTAHSVTLSVEMEDTNYRIIGSYDEDNGSLSNGAIAFYSKTTTTFMLKSYSADNVSWEVKGYKASS